jgi:hypothetical protein
VKSQLVQSCPEQAAQIASQPVEAARGVPHVPVETERCALWLQAARAADRPDASTAAEKLQACIQALEANAHTPELQDLLRKAQKTWTAPLESQ